MPTDFSSTSDVRIGGIKVGSVSDLALDPKTYKAIVQLAHPQRCANSRELHHRRGKRGIKSGLLSRHHARHQQPDIGAGQHHLRTVSACNRLIRPTIFRFSRCISLLSGLLRPQGNLTLPGRGESISAYASDLPPGSRAAGACRHDAARVAADGLDAQSGWLCPIATGDLPDGHAVRHGHVACHGHVEADGHGHAGMATTTASSRITSNVRSPPHRTSRRPSPSPNLRRPQNWPISPRSPRAARFPRWRSITIRNRRAPHPPRSDLLERPAFGGSSPASVRIACGLAISAIWSRIMFIHKHLPFCIQKYRRAFDLRLNAGSSGADPVVAAAIGACPCHCR